MKRKATSDPPMMLVRHSYNTRSRQRVPVVENAANAEDPGNGNAQVVATQAARVEGRIIYDPKNIDKFLREIRESEKIVFLDISAIRGDPPQNVQDALSHEIHKVVALKLALGDKPDFGLGLMEKAKALKLLEVSFVRRTKANDQRQIIHHLLNMELKSLEMTGTFTAKFDAPEQPFANKQLTFLRCPSVPKNNEFVKVLIAQNKTFLRYVYCSSTPIARDLIEVAECKDLTIVSVETFQDLEHMKALPTSKSCIMVRGSKKETADEVFDVIVNSAEDSVLSKIQHLSVNALDRVRMHHVLAAIALCCIKLKGLYLNGWRGDVKIRGTLKRMPLLKTLKFDKCINMDIQIMEDLINNGMLPNLKRLLIVRTTWNSRNSIKHVVDRLHAARPNLIIDLITEGEPEEGEAGIELTWPAGFRAICPKE